MDLDSIGVLNKEGLKSLCRKRNLSVSGNKSDLLDRLRNSEISPSEPPIKRKRPDLAKKGSLKKNTVERVIKKSLIGTLKNKKLFPVIQEWVCHASKSMNRGSLLFNRFLIYSLSNGLELPDFSLKPNEDTTTQNFFNHCFKTGLRKSNSDFKIQTVWDEYFSSFPVHTPKTGESQSNTWIAKNYSVMFYNSLKFNFESRQKKYIRHWLEKNNLEKSWSHSILCAVNGWKCKTDPPKEALEFISSQRKILKPPEKGISEEWMDQNRNVILGYFWVILQFLETIESARKFNLAPIHSISSHFCMIDTFILYYMSREAGIIPESMKYDEFNSNKEENFRRIFQFKNSTRYNFTYHVQTDGVSVCFHYRIPKAEKKETTNEIVLTERMIGIDPGRSNIVFGVEKSNEGRFKTYRLTRNEYYCASGMNKRKQQTVHWQKEIEEEERVFSRISTKTTQSEQWDSFLKDYISVYDVLWEHKTGKKWARARFRVFGLKKKVIDRFFNRMEGPSKPTVLFGSSKFKPNGRNELSAPTTSIFRACERRFKVHLIDEFNTTKVCADCDEGLSPVFIYSKKLERNKEIRGLRRCCSSVCSQASYKNRDLNAAVNILRCNSSVRPTTLSRESTIAKGKPWYMKHARGKKKT